ncbi:glycerophosphodiester phosphodiesterase family protein [Nocardioides sp. B-3]|uniref:glycerophosphodiester phosphodiesterase family protein n=1 Tax=Nocardioides sp. B-3 TaxID=2895565 RepID=UPI002153819C|nr:glycerophosphodiester phosphodiesterase family protein [Nocardioides sp. B-3]UUZ60689.1 hypothetical protein LP418_07710 [Nocardioides sp. B-3]
MIMHDTTLARTTDVEQVFPDRAPWSVGSFTLAEIKQLDAGSWFSPAFAGERVPTPAEWVGAVGNRAGMLPEPKAPELYPGIELDLDKELRALPEFTRALKRGEVVVRAFNHVWLKAYRDLAPDVPTGLLFGTAPDPSPDRRGLDVGRAGQSRAGCHRRGHGHSSARRWHGDQRLDRERRSGHASRVAWQVDGIITNYPQVLAEILRKG